MDNNEIKVKLKNLKSVEDLLDTMTTYSEPISKMNIHLKEREKEVNIKESATLRKIVDVKYFIALCKTIETFIEKDEAETARNLLKDILVAKDENLGKFYEMMAYYFLISTCMPFKPQIQIQSTECYKKGDKGYDADGLIKEWNCVFDVKMFGIVFPHIVTAEKKLQEKVNEQITERIKQFKAERSKNIQSLSDELNNETNTEKKKILMDKIVLEKRKIERMVNEEKSNLWKYVLKIDGVHNLDMDNMKKNIFSELERLAEELVKKAWDSRLEKWENLTNWDSENDICKHGLGFIQMKVNETNYTCTLYSPISMHYNGGIVIRIHGNDMYEWAKNNRFYFMHDASQFVKDRPYIIICPFDKESSGPFLSFTDNLDGYFRALCRRIFMDLNRMTDRDVDDGKAVPVTIAEASKKITGIIFIETSAIAKGGRYDCVWAYLNPNADNPLAKHQINYFHNISALVDDFRYDNY